MAAWAQGRERAGGGPWLVYLSPTNLCNSHCRACGHGFVMRRQRGLMDWGLFERLAHGLPSSVRKVYLMKQGEPLLHPRIGQMAAALRRLRPDLHIALHTNAITGRAPVLAELAANVDSLGVSISATSAQTYRQVHGVNAFEAVLRRLARLSDLVTASGSAARPHLFIDYVRQPGNAHEDPEAVRDFFLERFAGVASVDLHPLYNFHGVTGLGDPPIPDGEGGRRFPACVFPWAAMAVCHDGKASYCFVEPREDVFLGDLTRRAWLDVWQGRAYSEFRRQVAARAYDELWGQGFGCRRCSWLCSARAQAPRNLCGGYTSSYGASPPTLGQLWEMGSAQVFRLSADLMLNGEVHQALGCLAVLEESSLDDHLGAATRELAQLARLVLRAHGQRFAWQGEIAQWTEDSPRQQPLYLTRQPQA